MLLPARRCFAGLLRGAPIRRRRPAAFAGGRSLGRAPLSPTPRFWRRISGRARSAALGQRRLFSAVLAQRRLFGGVPRAWGVPPAMSAGALP